METKPWYKSKLIHAGLITFLWGGSEAVNTMIQSGELSLDAIGKLILGIAIAYIRKAHTNTVVK